MEFPELDGFAPPVPFIVPEDPAFMPPLFPPGVPTPVLAGEPGLDIELPEFGLYPVLW